MTFVLQRFALKLLQSSAVALTKAIVLRSGHNVVYSSLGVLYLFSLRVFF